MSFYLPAAPARPRSNSTSSIAPARQGSLHSRSASYGTRRLSKDDLDQLPLPPLPIPVAASASASKHARHLAVSSSYSSASSVSSRSSRSSRSASESSSASSVASSPFHHDAKQLIPPPNLNTAVVPPRHGHPDTKSTTVRIAKRFHRRIARHDLATIVDRCGAPSDPLSLARLVHFPAPEDPSETITLTAQVPAFLQSLSTALVAHAHYLRANEPTTLGVRLPAHQHKTLQGISNRNIRKLLQETGCQVYFASGYNSPPIGMSPGSRGDSGTSDSSAGEGVGREPGDHKRSRRGREVKDVVPVWALDPPENAAELADASPESRVICHGPRVQCERVISELQRRLRSMKGLQSRVTAPLLWYCAIDDQYVRSRMNQLGVTAEITRRPSHSLLSPPPTLSPLTHSNSITSNSTTSSTRTPAAASDSDRSSLTFPPYGADTTCPLPGVSFTLVSNYSRTSQTGSFEWKLTASTLPQLEEAERLLTELIEAASAKSAWIGFLDFTPGTAGTGLSAEKVVQRAVGTLGKTITEVEERTATTIKVYKGEGKIVIIGSKRGIEKAKLEILRLTHPTHIVYPPTFSQASKRSSQASSNPSSHRSSRSSSSILNTPAYDRQPRHFSAGSSQRSRPPTTGPSAYNYPSVAPSSRNRSLSLSSVSNSGPIVVPAHRSSAAQVY